MERENQLAFGESVQPLLACLDVLTNSGTDVLSQRFVDHLVTEAHDLLELLSERRPQLSSDLFGALSAVVKYSHLLRHLGKLRGRSGDRLDETTRGFRGQLVDTSRRCLKQLSEHFGALADRCAQELVIDADAIGEIANHVPAVTTPPSPAQPSAQMALAGRAQQASPGDSRTILQLGNLFLDAKNQWTERSTDGRRAITAEQSRLLEARLKNALQRLEALRRTNDDPNLASLSRNVEICGHLAALHVALARSRIADDVALGQRDTELLAAVGDFANHHIGAFLERGAETVRLLIDSYAKPSRIVCTLPDKLMYLHARPIRMILQIVNHYETPVTMRIGDDECNANSIIEMLKLVGEKGTPREFVFEGDDSVLCDLALLFKSGLGEDEANNPLPDSLDYLRSGND